MNKLNIAFYVVYSLLLIIYWSIFTFKAEVKSDPYYIGMLTMSIISAIGILFGFLFGIKNFAPVWSFYAMTIGVFALFIFMIMSAKKIAKPSNPKDKDTLPPAADGTIFTLALIAFFIKVVMFCLTVYAIMTFK